MPPVEGTPLSRPGGTPFSGRFADVTKDLGNVLGNATPNLSKFRDVLKDLVTEKSLAQAKALPAAMQPANAAMAELIKAVRDVEQAVRELGGGIGQEKGHIKEAAETHAKSGLSFRDTVKAVAGGVNKFVSESLAGIAKLGFGLGLFQQFVANVSSQIGSLVALYSPVEFRRFQLAVQDTQAAIGSALLPVLANFREVVRGIGSVFASLTSRGQVVIAGLAAVAAGIGVMTVATIAFSAAVNSATFGLSAVLGAVAGGIAGVTTGLLGMGFALKDEASVQAIVTKLAGAFSSVLNALGDALVPLAEALMPLVEQFLADFADAVSLLAAGIKEIAPFLYLMAEATAALAREMKSLFGVMGLLGNLARMLGVEARPAPHTADGMAVRNVSVQQGVEGFINKTLQEAFSIGTQKPEVQQVNLLEQANQKLQAIQDWLTNANNQLGVWKNDLINGFRDAVKGALPSVSPGLDMARRGLEEMLR